MDLPPGSSAQVRTAIATLEHVAQVRNSKMHDGTEHRGVAALRALGIIYPVIDWAAAWLRVEQETIRAVDTLRVEIQ